MNPPWAAQLERLYGVVRAYYRVYGKPLKKIKVTDFQWRNLQKWYGGQVPAKKMDIYGVPLEPGAEKFEFVT